MNHQQNQYIYRNECFGYKLSEKRGHQCRELTFSNNLPADYSVLSSSSVFLNKSGFLPPLLPPQQTSAEKHCTVVSKKKKSQSFCSNDDHCNILYYNKIVSTPAHNFHIALVQLEWGWRNADLQTAVSFQVRTHFEIFADSRRLCWAYRICFRASQDVQKQ